MTLREQMDVLGVTEDELRGECGNGWLMGDGTWEECIRRALFNLGQKRYFAIGRVLMELGNEVEDAA